MLPKVAILLSAICALIVCPLAASERGSDERMTLDLSPAYRILKADKKQNAWVRVGLTGFELEAESDRAPINVALVLDRSGSMKGEKIARAREAAISALRRLRPDDIVSVITYSSTVEVLVPATKLTDKETLIQAISRITAEGNTALFAGVSKGAAELRKFGSEDRVNRIILLSDGLANRGPNSPSELGALGASFRKENISVTTLGLGLGYNEDLMTQLASRSGGNHEFIEEAASLARIFDREFDDVTSVVAQDIKVKINVPEGIRPVRVLGNDAEISGQSININLSQIYSQQNKHVVLELEVPATEDGEKLQLLDVIATYKNMQSLAVDTLASTSSIRFSDDQSKVEASLNKPVMEDVVALISNEQNKLATIYLDRGDFAKCVETIESNTQFLKTQAEKLDSIRLQEVFEFNAGQGLQVQEQDLNRARKSMRQLQLKLDGNFSVSPAPGSAAE